MKCLAVALSQTSLRIVLLVCLLMGLSSATTAAQDATSAQDSAQTDAAEGERSEAPPADVATDPAAPPAATDPAPSSTADADAASAKQAYDVLQQQWTANVEAIKTTQQSRLKAEGDERKALDAQIAQLRAEAEALIGKITDAGVAVYKAAPQAYPDVNATTMAIIQFHLVGDAQGDGGDQYERALGPIKALLEAGGGAEWPHLYAWGGVAAYCSNDFDLASEYFQKAQEAGELGGPSRGQSQRDAQAKLRAFASQYHQALAGTRQAWDKEQQLRAAEAEADNLPRVKLTTSRGDIVIELFENEAPQAVANFITLVKKGFYDGVVFHRVLPGFMAQGGDPQGTGSGGPGYCIRCECRQPNFRRHFRGSLSMAKTTAPNTGGSQFFLTFVPTSFLDGEHTVFGRVIEGMETAAGIKRRDPESSAPATPDKIVKAVVVRDRGHAYEFARLPAR